MQGRTSSLHDRGQDEDDQEDGEHALLHLIDAVAQSVEREGVEEGDEKYGGELAIGVAGIAPEVTSDASGEHAALRPGRGGIFGFIGVVTRLVFPLCDELVNLVIDILQRTWMRDQQMEGICAP